MSPIDIVPVDNQNVYDDRYMEHTLNSHNGVIVNHSAAYTLTDVVSRETSLTSIKPIIAKPPTKGTGRVVSHCTKTKI